MKKEVLFLFFCLAQNSWASEVLIKFHEDSPITLEDGIFASSSGGSGSVSVADPASDADAINDLIFSLPTSGVATELTGPAIADDTTVDMDLWRMTAEQYWGETLEDLESYYFVDIPEGSDHRVPEFLDLEDLDSVESVEHVPDPIPATAIPSLEAHQGYLNDDANGIYARQAWKSPGGRGEGIKLIDIEGAWITDHEDFPQLFHNSGGFVDRTHWLYHGTAVMGVLGAKNNQSGITGIVSDASFGVESIYKDSQGFANAITNAAKQVGKGGIVIIEVQYPSSAYTPNCICNLNQCGYVPAEYFSAYYNAIKQAVGNGVIVIQAAGNGSVDLDHPSFNGVFDRSTRDSGAIFVGASLSNSRSPICFTNYGSRIDTHAWGHNVATLSYGDLFNNDGENQDYTGRFSGTSSAAPIVAGAAASIQGIRKAQGKSLLTSIEMRKLLSETGARQTGGLSKKIGTLPNITEAIKEKEVVNHDKPDPKPTNPDVLISVLLMLMEDD